MSKIAQAVVPLAEHHAEEASYAYRRGRVHHQAVTHLEQLMREGRRWMLEAGIDTPRQNGVPQGNPLSPLLSNLYLDALDEALLDADHRLVRFADDFVVLARTRDRAEQALELTREVLERLALRLNPTKTQVVHSDQGFEFLGWNFVRTLAWPQHRLAAEAAPALPQTAAAPHAAPATAPQPEPAVLRAAPAEEALADQPQAAPITAPETVPPDDEPPLPALAPLQRTLYLVDETTRLEVDNQRLAVRRGEKSLLTVSVLNVDQVIVFGPVQVSTQALQLLARAGGAIGFLSRMGRYYGRFESADGAALGLLEAQFQRSRDPGFALAIARRLVAAKLRNSATVLARTLRRHQAADPAKQASHARAPSQLREWADGAERIDSLAALRGLEGAGAALHFQVLKALLPPDWGFVQRLPRPAPDPVNALLSFGYSMLYQCVAGLLRARGLHAHLGLFHASDGAHMALASDLMEPYRAYAVDATVLKLLFSGEIHPGDCGALEGDAYRLSPDTQRRFIRLLELRFNAPLTHRRTREPMDFKRLVDADIRQLGLALREGQVAEFWPTVWD